MHLDSPPEFPARLDVSLRLDGSLAEAVARVNESIVAVGLDEIRFSPNQGAIPHVTLLMGEVATLEDFESLADAVRRFAQTTETFEIGVGSPYLVELERRWVFMDALPAVRFRALRFALHDVSAGLIELEPYGPGQRLARHRGMRRATRGSYRRGAHWAGVSGRASALQLCAVGVHGTNVLRYREFALSHAEQ